MQQHLYTQRYMPLLLQISVPPDQSLARGEFFKLICGASFEDASDVRNLALVYTLAGADCVDCAAERAVVAAAQEGIDTALAIAKDCGASLRRPWTMISVNDDARDPHFRKAAFDARRCPADCPRPCERVCPAQAIAFPDEVRGCYGCGRCIPVCPPGIIDAVTYLRTPADVLPLLDMVEAIEVHTKGDVQAFRDLWAHIGPEADTTLRAVSISFPDMGEETPEYLQQWADVLQGGVGLRIWQTDGRPMSGDIGKGTALASVAFAEKVLKSGALPFGAGRHHVQLAGGTNAATVPRLQAMGLLGSSDAGGAKASGAAFGGYARKVVSDWLQRLPDDCTKVEQDLGVLRGALLAARELVAPLKEQ
ncbi:4Fe-4S ferredoxin iron-sulfur binding domain protein [Tribonema minus]|uniref:4Fe-4S ferredoxin iron-sulfur binding domain protein n=1 Tax=Tribonema minus TaxID=303371 RepID=A0A835Z7A0_9STRA|nr:4Fe-4S ferredoxin iron-sulfur binding domain protein [Tribonema minus]